jgi:hypothetical protein
MVIVVKGGGRAPPHPYQPGSFYHHDGKYARKRPLPLCVLYSKKMNVGWRGLQSIANDISMSLERSCCMQKPLKIDSKFRK